MITSPVKITLQVFENGRALGEFISAVNDAQSEQDAVDSLFKLLRVDRQYRFLGAHGFIVPTGKDGDYMLFNGGKA